MTSDVRWRRELIFLLVLAITVYSAAWAGRMVANMTPVKREVVQVVKRVEKVERVVYPRPPRHIYPPLKNPLDACALAPAEIVKMDVSPMVGGSKNDQFTWVTLRPVGDDYTVQCYKSGDYSFGWHEGDIIVLNGKVSSAP